MMYGGCGLCDVLDADVQARAPVEEMLEAGVDESVQAGGEFLLVMDQGSVMPVFGVTDVVHGLVVDFFSEFPEFGVDPSLGEDVAEGHGFGIHGGGVLQFDDVFL
jgi:high-affinity K+ transport system ATPase subunit B